MTAGLEEIRERMAEHLKRFGVEAVTAWPGQERKKWTCPVVVVSLRGCQGEPSGFQDYLGEQYDESSGLWLERYGRKATVTLGLDLYAPAEGAGQEVQACFDALAGALTQEEPEGLDIQEFSCGETAYDQSERLLKRSAQVVCRAYLCATVRDGEEFAEFELRGGLKQ
jgi:hypothetical protein